MNSGQCHRRPQFHGLVINSPYAEGPESSVQTYHRMLPFDGFPRAQPDQQFLTAASPSPNLYSNNYNLANSMPMSPSPLPWNGSSQNSSSFEEQNAHPYYNNYMPTVANNETYAGAYLRNTHFTSVPRTMPYDQGFLKDTSSTMDALEPSLYLMEANEAEMENSSTGRSMMSSGAMDSSRAFERLSLSRSPRLGSDHMGNNAVSFNSQHHPFRLPSADSEEGHSSREMTAVEPDDHGADEPYAKLIYRALMSAPNHSMVLQEIYQWFRDNTTKGSSDTKGWMNSIRHNLSMNAAFRKTERKVPGDETKKSTEWVLEEFAIKDGVQSTTRYRKGNGRKKFMKSDHPAPARQSSGRKGGICASKTKLQRQRIKEERMDYRTATPRFEASRFQYQTRPQIGKRQRSPLTPPSMENIVASSSPYFLPKVEPYDIPFEDMCGLQDVQGVCIDPDSPLFSNDQDPFYHSSHPMANSPY